MYASMLAFRILHGLCNALNPELSLLLNEFCKSVLLLCTDSQKLELQLSRHVFTWLDPQHEVTALNIIVFLTLIKRSTRHSRYLCMLCL